MTATRFPTLRHHGASQGRSGGFSLIEILITLLIMSIGLLGMGALLISGVRFNHSAYLRSQATILAYSMADRMRANMVGVVAGNYNNIGGSAGTATSTCTTTAGCTAAQLAADDNYQWNCELSSTKTCYTVQNQAATAGLLPDGRGVACLDNTPNDGTFDGTTLTPACDGGGNTYVIKVWWLDNPGGTNATGSCDPTVASANDKYKCFTMSFQP